MNNTLRAFVRASLMLEQDDVGTAPGFPDLGGRDPAGTECSEDSDCDEMVKANKYILDNFNNFFEAAKEELDYRGGMGKWVTREDLRSATQGFINMLNADKTDIALTRYPMRTALYLTGVLDGAALDPMEFLDAVGGILDEIVMGAISSAGSIEKRESRDRSQDADVLTETSLLGNLAMWAKDLYKFAWNPSLTAAVQDATRAARIDFIEKGATEADALKIVDDVVKHIKTYPSAKINDVKRSVRAPAGADATAYDNFIKAAYDAVQETKKKSSFGGRALWKAAGAQLLSSIGNTALYAALPIDIVLDEAGIRALVTDYVIRDAVAKSRAAIYKDLKDGIVLVPGFEDPEVSGKDFALAVEGLKNTALPGPNGKPLVSTSDLEAAIRSFEAIRATKGE
jgi:hypothetical protein